MAALNTKSAKLVGQVFHEDSRVAVAVRTDGSILKNTGGFGWAVAGKLRKGVTPEAHLAKRKAAGWRELRRGDLKREEML